MNVNVKGLILFAFGVSIGSIGTWKYFEKKYQQIAQEEIDSVIEVFSKRTEKATNADIRLKADRARDKPDMLTYVSKASEYVNYSDVPMEDQEEVTLLTDEIEIPPDPYVISPEDFGDMDGYDTTSLIYYADDVLADDDDRIVEDVDSIVGLDSLDTFGDYEDDSVFVRNDVLKCDYEILLDPRNYSDVIVRIPPTTERKPHEVN